MTLESGFSATSYLECRDPNSKYENFNTDTNLKNLEGTGIAIAWTIFRRSVCMSKWGWSDKRTPPGPMIVDWGAPPPPEPVEMLLLAGRCWLEVAVGGAVKLCKTEYPMDPNGGYCPGMGVGAPSEPN